MKTKMVTALLVVGMSLQAAAMGHPHNLFAAHKQIKAKQVAMSQSYDSDTTHSGLIVCTKATAITVAQLWSWFKQKGAN